MSRSGSSRPVLPLFAGAAVMIAAAFAWLGWRLLQHEQDVAAQQVQQRLDAAADLAAAALLRQTADLAAQLNVLAVAPESTLRDAARRLGGRLGSGARLVVIQDGSVETFPDGGLPYYPATPAQDSDDPIFAPADTYEFARRDPASAVRVLRPLATDRDARVRAGALVRLGRNLQKLTEDRRALAAYDDLAALGATRVGGLPSELVARYARATLFERVGDAGRLRNEARELDADLRDVRWRLDRATYLFYTRTAQRWLGIAGTPAPERGEALAAAIDLLWTEWPQMQRGERDPAGVRVTGDGDDAVLLLWHSAPGRLTAIAADARLVEREWLSPVRAGGDRQRVHFDLVTNGGRTLQPAIARASAVRTSSDTGLPWTLRVATADPAADAAELVARRRVIVGGLTLVAAVLLASTYTIGRAITREVEAVRLRSDFIAAVSHEFRSPLTAMRQVTEMLAGGRVTSDDRRSTYYTLLMRESQRLHRLVETLLDFGQSEAGAREYRRDHLDIARLVRETVAEFQSDASQHGCEVELADAHDPLLVRGDGEALSRAVWNLLENAAKYSPECRTIWVRVSHEGDRARVEVRDRGVGIAAEEHDAIFGKFFRGAAARSTGAKGTGLGLALVRHIVDGHDGEIHVSSEPGHGSTFTFTLPALSESNLPAVPKKGTAVFSARHSGGKDDCPLFRRVDRT